MQTMHNKDNILTKKGCKNTKSRKAVIDALNNSITPVSADEIFMLIKENGSSANISTVYRTLELMENKGLVNKLIMSEGKARFELTGDGHKHHLICTNCHKMVTIDICPIEKLETDVSQKTNYDITGHKLELYGVCPDCKKE